MSSIQNFHAASIHRGRYAALAEQERHQKKQRARDFEAARFTPEELFVLAAIYEKHKEMQEKAKYLDLHDPEMMAVNQALAELFTANDFDPARYAVYVYGVQSKAFHALLDERGLTRALDREETEAADAGPTLEEAERTALAVMEAYRETFTLDLEPVDLLPFACEWRSRQENNTGNGCIS